MFRNENVGAQGFRSTDSGEVGKVTREDQGEGLSPGVGGSHAREALQQLPQVAAAKLGSGNSSLACWAPCWTWVTLGVLPPNPRALLSPVQL